MRAGTAALRAGPARAGEWRVLHTQLQVTSLPMAFPSKMLKSVSSCRFLPVRREGQTRFPSALRVMCERGTVCVASTAPAAPGGCVPTSLL